MASNQAVVGIDLGGSKVQFALFDGTFKVLAEVKIRTEVEKDEKNFRKTLLSSLKGMLETAKEKKLKALQ